ncbi:hypothetical protein A1Q1_05924 [Trichosporon asahii var. asahii CBS 2479]|uniref:Uncharacterized protein n=1 Tax=Trichosporon asahii var. asahii (strain ATCC 90039 / CBS 2479 / JCM 2466 / KCTC 7840 / NBRC 103889/ NCYC 2677 / UAMH 7654) TaxID=1186058 RepID=J4U6I9_TRIAS|nr:hypothetical protein A1Q1_05924 [Trichosporon asahii var. asahii CBS 2479]EJT45775.1 hypothetical protein A1Q1_05924 [Trichosporon asahii var. asahii CBS 2479]
MARTKQTHPRAQPSTTEKRKAPPADAAAGTPTRSTRKGAKKVNPEEVAALQKALKEAEEKLEQAQEARNKIAAKLEALGQVVVVKPWTVDHLETDWASSLDDFRQTYGEFGEYEDELDDDDDAKRWIIRLLKMHDAIQGEFPSDGTGYIDEDGQWVDFEATDQDLEEFEWVDADPLW